MRFDLILCGLGLLTILAPPVLAAPVDAAPLVKTLQAVGTDGAGHRAATAAWQQLAKADAQELPTILAGMDGASPLAANWLRGAVDTIAERTLKEKEGGKLPAGELEKFTLDRKHEPRARRLAFEWLIRVDASAADRIIPGMLDDPSLELRRDAVARRLEAAAKVLADGQKDAALAEYRTALNAARDNDQVKLAADSLKKLGQPVDLARHFGFIQQWKLVGPFDNTGKKGFAVAYPPETQIDLTAAYPGKAGEVRWIDHATSDDYGKVNLNKALGKNKGAAAYAWAEFVSDSERDAELRVQCINANKVWLNGKLLISAEVYHASSKLDQYIGRGRLQRGVNVILVKVCENEQTEDWAQDWEFQLRVCDVTGTAILSQNRPPAPPADKSAVSLNSGAKP